MHTTGYNINNNNNNNLNNLESLETITNQMRYIGISTSFKTSISLIEFNIEKKI